MAIGLALMFGIIIPVNFLSPYKAKNINDPMIRGAAVSAWVRDHNTEITQKQGMELCALLDGRDRFYCVRRLSSPHLKR